MGEPTPVWTIGALLGWTENYFREAKLDSPRLDAQLLLSHALNCKKSDLYVRWNEQPTEAQRADFRAKIKARAAGTPVAYLVGHKEFFLLDFKVTPAVLIPRPSTETLVLLALDRLNGQPSTLVLDLGTGSGCIAISLAARHNGVRVVATDMSVEALAVARENAQTHGVAERIDFRPGDLFAPVRPDEKFALIVSNPPYIPTEDLAGLAKDVRDHEPKAALDGGSDGLAVINRIIDNANSDLMLEVGVNQADVVAAKMSTAGFGEVSIHKDADRIPRVVSGRRVG